MAVIYVSSVNASVYPCAYRGTDDSGQYYDPESRMNSEKNITNNVVGLDNDTVNLSDGGGSYVISFENNILKFVFKGYRFNIDLTGNLPSSETSETLGNLGTSGALYTYIKLINQTVNAGSAGRGYSTRILGNVAGNNNSSLDVANNFEGVGFEWVPTDSTPTVPSGCESFIVLNYEKQSNNSYIYTPVNTCVLSANMIDFDGEHNITEKFETERLIATGDTTLNGTEIQGDLDVDGNGDFGGYLNVDSYIKIGDNLEVGPQDEVGGDYCAAIGVDNFNNSNNALAVGDSNNINANNSFAQGDSTTTYGMNSHAEGELTTAYGKDSHAEGSTTVATVKLTGSAAATTYNYSNAGISLKKDYILKYINTFAKIVSLPASGVVVVSNTLSSTALNNATVEIVRGIAYGANSHSEGVDTSAVGDNSHAEGSSTIASGMSSHAEGYGSMASGAWSHAEGHFTVASGTSSHAEGNYTIAASGNQHVFGQCNIEDNSGEYIEIVGNGSTINSRSNARTLDWAGNEVLAGDLTVSGGLDVTGGKARVFNDLEVRKNNTDSSVGGNVDIAGDLTVSGNVELYKNLTINQGGNILLDSNSYINYPLNKVNALSRWTAIPLTASGTSPAGYAKNYLAAQIGDFAINYFPFNVMFRIWYDNGEGGVILNLGVMTLCYRQQVLSTGARFVLASKDYKGNNIILSVLAKNNGLSDLRVQSEFNFGNTVTVEYCII